MPINPEKISFHAIKSAALIRDLDMRNRINNVLVPSLRADFPDRTDTERLRLLTQAEVTRANPNRGVGGSLMLRKQAFTRAISILAVHEGEVVGHLPTANNASSQKEGLMGIGERQVKLRLESLGGKGLIGHRYVWLGQAAMSPDLRTLMYQTNPEEINVADAMIGMAVALRDPRQPSSSYPYEGEIDWMRTLVRTGFEARPDGTRDVPAFGVDATPVRQEAMVAGPGVVTDYLSRHYADTAGLYERALAVATQHA